MLVHAAFLLVAVSLCCYFPDVMEGLTHPGRQKNTHPSRHVPTLPNFRHPQSLGFDQAVYPCTHFLFHFGVCLVS